MSPRSVGWRLEASPGRSRGVTPGEEHWIAIKHILKYLRRTRDYMLVYQDESLEPIGYTDPDFQSDIDSRKSTSGYVFTFGGGAISWLSVKL